MREEGGREGGDEEGGREKREEGGRRGREETREERGKRGRKRASLQKSKRGGRATIPVVRAAPENLCPNDRIHTGSGLGGEEGKEGRRR